VTRIEAGREAGTGAKTQYPPNRLPTLAQYLSDMPVGMWPHGPTMPGNPGDRVGIGATYAESLIRVTAMP